MLGFIFDYGGTIDTHGDHWSWVILDAYRHAGLSVPIEEFKDAYIYAERALEAHPIILPTDTFLDLMRKKISLQFTRLRQLHALPPQIHTENLDFHNPDNSDSPDPSDNSDNSDFPSLQEAIAHYCYRHARKCVSESSHILRRLAERYPLVVVSNFYGNLRTVLTDFGIADYFTDIIDSTVVGIRKPDPAIFRLAIQSLQQSLKTYNIETGHSPAKTTGGNILPNGNIIVIGDSYKNDIHPALTLGLRTRQISGRPWPPRDLEVV